MHTFAGKSTLAVFLGLVLAGGVSALPASAQDNTDNGTMERKATQIDPMPVQYPMASPGSLDLNHWADYTQSRMEPGSAEEARRERQRMQDEQARERESEQRMSDYQDRTRVAPMPVQYPMASPGSLDLNHWADYTQSRLAPGSAEEARRERQRMQDERVMSDMPSDYEDRNQIDPMPVQYPMASPGSLDLNHWADYTQSRMEPGSAAEARMRRQRMREERMRNRQENTPQ
ncbi:MAG TPA: hypothetical protein VFB38_16705 [Chthonomonadaceae bacterium]|nr:hypothetical protein [Chthonomonadaceae bacterium]